MIKLRKNKIRQSSRVQLKTTQKIYMSLGILISLAASSFLYMSAENAGQRQEVWVTSNKIAAGQIIDESNIELIRVDLGRLQANYLSSDLEIIGKTALEPLSSGTILRPELIGKMSTLRNVALRISNGHLPPSL